MRLHEFQPLIESVLEIVLLVSNNKVNLEKLKYAGQVDKVFIREHSITGNEWSNLHLENAILW